MNGKADATRKRFSKTTEIFARCCAQGGQHRSYTVCTIKWEGIERG